MEMPQPKLGHVVRLRGKNHQDQDPREEPSNRFGDHGLQRACREEGRLMPTVLRTEGFRFYFFSLDWSEPPHIHVAHGNKLAKYWLAPVELARSEGFRAHELNRVRTLVIEHRITFQEAWDEHFRSQGRQD